MHTATAILINGVLAAIFRAKVPVVRYFDPRTGFGNEPDMVN
jgi:hypothetical protein